MPSDKYIIGVIRSIESRMLDENKLTRMSEAANFDSAFAAINETEYAPLLAKVSHPFDYEEMLCRSVEELKNFCLALAEGKKAVRVLWERYDFENIKILIKAKFKEIEDPPLFSCGNLDPLLLKNYILKETGWIDGRFRGLIIAATKFYSESCLAVFDFLDHEYLKYLKKTADEEKSPLLLKWAEYLEDPSKSKALFKQIKFAGYAASGFEPLIAFIIAKQIEVKNISFILKCKENNISANYIRERILT